MAHWCMFRDDQCFQRETFLKTNCGQYHWHVKMFSPPLGSTVSDWNWIYTNIYTVHSTHKTHANDLTVLLLTFVLLQKLRWIFCFFSLAKLNSGKVNANIDVNVNVNWWLHIEYIYSHNGVSAFAHFQKKKKEKKTSKVLNEHTICE